MTNRARPHSRSRTDLVSIPAFSSAWADALSQNAVAQWVGGIHKDDLEINLLGTAFKIVASQGQRKSLLFALKLAEFEVLKNCNGFPPLLLLDDLFEKLDQQRMHNLLQWVCSENNGQIFITDTHRERLHEQLSKLEVSFQLLMIT